MERTKLLMGSTHSQLNSSNSERLELNRSRLHPMYRSSGPVSYGFASLETSQMLDTETICSPNGSDASSGEFFLFESIFTQKITNTKIPKPKPKKQKKNMLTRPPLLRTCTHCTKIKVGSGPPSLQNEFDNIQTVERSAETDTLKQMNQATSPQSDQPSPVNLAPPPISAGRSTTKNEKRSANTLYQELSFQDNEESEENEVTGNYKFFFFLFFLLNDIHFNNIVTNNTLIN